MNMPTIDADAHVIETDRTWDYMDEADSKFRPIVVSSHDGKKQFWLVDGRATPRGPINTAIPESNREMQDIQSRLRHMDELEIDIQVLYPTVFLAPLTNRPEIETALCKSYNRWMADIFRKADHRLPWIAMLPLMTMDATLAEIQFSKANGACGLFTRGLVDNKLLSDPYFFPLYEEAGRLGLPVCVHASTGDFDWIDLFQRESGFSQFKLPVLIAFHTIVYKEIPQKFPSLRFGFIEVKAQWVPYLIHELARRFKGRGKSPVENIMRDNRLYVACQTDDDLSYVLKYSGEDNLVIGTDYGHSDTSSEIEALRRLRDNSDVSSGVLDKILYDNARALYGLDV
jgi:predicted TIM-barrel fold metal-dependent hydrolase